MQHSEDWQVSPLYHSHISNIQKNVKISRDERDLLKLSVMVSTWSLRSSADGAGIGVAVSVDLDLDFAGLTM